MNEIACVSVVAASVKIIGDPSSKRSLTWSVKEVNKGYQNAGAELCKAQGSLGLLGLDKICAFFDWLTWFWFAKLAYEFDFLLWFCHCGAFGVV